MLSDKEKRSIYDRYGEDGVKQHEQSGGRGGGGAQDIFSQFFGGGGTVRRVRGIRWGTGRTGNAERDDD